MFKCDIIGDGLDVINLFVNRSFGDASCLADVALLVSVFVSNVIVYVGRIAWTDVCIWD